MTIFRSLRGGLLLESSRTVAACALLGLLAAPLAAHAADSVEQSFVPSGNVHVLARFHDAQPSGIVHLVDGRFVLSFPTSAQTHPGPVLAVWKGGSELQPFPDAAAQKELKSPLGMTVDALGRVWVIDEGVVAGQTEPQTPAIILIDPRTNSIIRRFALTSPVVLPDSHINDIRVDLTHGKSGTAFISDTSQTTHPALIVLDIASGQARRILAEDRSVSAAAGHVMEVDGKLFRYNPDHPQMPQGGVNGIGLSVDSSRLFWSPFSSRCLYSAPTAVLSDPVISEAGLSQAVRDEGEVGVVDGIFTAPDGSLYMADEERHGVIRRSPDGTLSLVAHDPRLISPDSLASGEASNQPVNRLIMTVGQWARLPVFHDGHDMQQRPYLIVRIDLKNR
ncbi:L-dopachrome tautomerase-related protein [Acetobacter sicerae]|uniref:L-dopachrome tautomerase-related protein n=1 Tax=Acetobacter sicerae TaxID=85325 RepID=UPI00156A9792|nr:L-dopachrome tautomerase-related protein [Acetobacter sicerae]